MGLIAKVKEGLEAYVDSFIVKSRSVVDEDKRKKAEAERQQRELIERKALTLSDSAVANEVGYRERASGVTFEILRQMSMRDSIISAIIQTRVNQIKAFGVHQPDKYSTGFKIILRDEEEEPSDEDKDLINKLESWILKTGFSGPDSGRPPETETSFSDCLGMLTRDVLVYDQISLETVNAKDHSLHYFVPAASGTIRFAAYNLRQDKNLIDTFNETPEEIATDAERRDKEIAEQDNKRPKDEKYRYVQVSNAAGGRISRGFFDDELILKMMNPTTEIDTGGYSIGPLEYCANIVSYHLFAEAHNRLFFVQGFAQRGILHIEGEVPPLQLDAFRRQWREQVSSSVNAWRTPIIAGEGKVNWIDLGASNKDMEWSAWIEYLIKLMTAIFGMAPQEINFDISKSYGGATLNEGTRNESILEHAKDRGLRPLLRFFEDLINENLIKRFDEELYKRYKFVFCGLDAETRKEELERQEKEGQVYKTIDEIRAEHDLEPMDEGGGIIQNPNFMSWFTQFSEDAHKMQDQMAQQGQGPGGEGGDGEEGPPSEEELQGPNNADTEGGGEENPELDKSKAMKRAAEAGLKKAMKLAKARRSHRPRLLKVEYYSKK